MVHHNTVSYRLRGASEHFKMALTALNCNAAGLFPPVSHVTPIHDRGSRLYVSLVLRFAVGWIYPIVVGAPR